MITASSFNICVAGTHGKTTTSTMIAHILRHSGFGCNAFLGGISSNYETNFWSSEKNVCVAEADEYDRSFLQLSPDIAVITAIDPDHLDIYGNEENFRTAFMHFSEKIKEDGFLIIKRGLEDDFKTKHQLSYSSTDASANCFAANMKMKNGSYFFDVHIGKEVVEGFELNMGGMHNVENAVAAIVAARRAGVDDDKIRESLAAFKGVKRRFEYIIKTDETVMIDDYAHHPQELSALIKGAKGLFSDKKCTVIFQPHLYTRTRDFATGFAESLNLADEIILLPIYPAREKPIEGVESEMIKELMQSEKVICFSKEELLNWVSEKKAKGEIEMLITAGAGDIDTLVTPIKNIIA
jgi:UDP-N-acetylmuramate--alanine ligase